MKRIKTVSLLSSITAVAGVAVSLMTPFQASAFADELISPGQDIPPVKITTNSDDFDAKHTIRKNNTPSYALPVYQSNKQWQLMQGVNTDEGTSSVAFNRPFDTSADFSFTTTVNLSSDSSGGEYNTDFVGMVISTVPSANLADEQLIPWTGTGSPDHAGYGSAHVKWQTAFGTQAFDPSENWFPILRPEQFAHRDVVRQTMGTNQNTISGKSIFYTSSWNRNLTRKYNVKYDHSAHKVSYSLVTDGGETIVATNIIPSDIDKVYIGALGAAHGNGHDDVGGVTLSNMSGQYVSTKTKVHFYDEQNKNMDPKGDATIEGIVGENLSVEGNGERNFLAPSFTNYELDGSPADRTITTVENDADNNITVRYKRIPGVLPYEIVDDDLNGKTLSSGTVPGLHVGDSYSEATFAEIKKQIPKFTTFAKIENAAGILEVNKDNNVLNDPVIIHVTDDKKDDQVTFTRTVNYKMQPGIDNVTPPQKSIETPFKVNRRTDYYLQSINPDYKPTLDSNAKFGQVKTPDFPGYRPDRAVVDFSTEKINDSTPLTGSTDVTYYGILSVYAPTLDFGTVQTGDRVYDGADPKDAEKMDGELAIADTNPDEKSVRWTLNA